jgi:5-keto 4-deoxyuronate isomerase
MFMTGTNVDVANTTSLGFESGGTGTSDTFISRSGAGVINIGTTGTNAGGTVNAASYEVGGVAGLASKTCTINTANVTTGITLTITGGIITATTTC